MEPIFLVNGILPAYFAGQPGFDLALIRESLAYVLDGAGWRLFKRNGVSTAVVPVDSVSGLPRLEPVIQFTAAKIPLDLVRRVTAWFHAVYLKHKSEAVGYLYYRVAETGLGEWNFLPPPQTVGAAHTKYDRPPRREGWQVAGTIHSHASMSAFHSSVDDADEASFDGIHITIGHLDGVPEYSCSVVVQGQRVKLDPSVLIDGMAPAEEVPSAWLEAVKLSAPSGFPEPFATRAQALYKKYYAGELGESDYKSELAKIEAGAEAERSARMLGLRADDETDGPGGFGFEFGLTAPRTLPREMGKKGGGDDDRGRKRHRP